MNTDGLQAVRDEGELEAALAHPLVVLYKHSPLCGMSAIAAGEVRQFAEIMIATHTAVNAQAGELADGVVNGIQKVREWAAGPPLNIGDAQVDSASNAAIDRIQNSVGSIDELAGRCQYGALDHIPELANVSGPGMVLEPLQGFTGHGLHIATMLAREPR
mgnify:CR=1 FL=1